MLHYAVVFLVVALIAAIFGFYAALLPGPLRSRRSSFHLRHHGSRHFHRGPCSQRLTRLIRVCTRNTQPKGSIMNISKSVKTSNESLAETVNGAAEHAAESLGRAVDSARDRIDGVANTVTAAAMMSPSRRHPQQSACRRLRAASTPDVRRPCVCANA